jgi:GGDEF domain-containing protein
MVTVTSTNSTPRSGIGSILSSILAKIQTPDEDPADLGSANETALRRMVLILLEAVEVHTIPGDEIDYRQFRADIRHISESFTRATNPDDIFVLSGQFFILTKDYFDRATRFISLQNAEYQKMVSMFTDTISTFNSSGQRTVLSLKEIEQQIEHATLIEDVRALRVRLGECLGNIRAEIDRHEVVTAEVERGLDQEPSPLVASQPMLHSVNDSVTGLPTEQQAKSDLMSALEADDESFVVPILIQGIEKTYAQLGNEVGDSCLYKFSQALRALSDKGYSLYRWRGNTFLAILRRPVTIPEVRRELHSLIGTARNQSIQVGDRIIWLPVSAAWDVIAVKPPLSSLLLEIDKFLTS